MNASSKIEMPKRIERQELVKYMNGFGPQSPGIGTNGTYILCFCDYLSDDQVASIKAASSSETFEHDDFLAKPYVSVHWSEFHLQNSILTAMLTQGITFWYQAKYRVKFNHTKVHAFTPELLEETRIAQVRKSMSDIAFGPVFIKYSAEQGNLLDVWNWTSVEGKALCAELRDMNDLPQLDEATDPDNYYLWSSFADEGEAPLKRKREDVSVDEEEEDTCMVCMDKRANTLVVPCGHVVVCVDCSAKLADTPDRHTCVRCRAAITSVLCDEK
jgi:hypothetical protein